MKVHALPGFLVNLMIAGLAFAAGQAEAAATAQALTPLSTSVEAGKSKIFSASFREANGTPSAGVSVVFSNDACGTFANGALQMTVTADASGVASATFTANPGSTVTCRVTASAGASVTFNVITYRQELLAVVSTTTPAILRAGDPFVFNVSLMVGVYTLYDVDLSVRIVQRTANASLSPAAGNTGSSGTLAITVVPDRVGDFSIEVVVGSRVQPVALRYDASTLALHDMWWTQPQENGWGIGIVQHRDTLVALIFAYDTTGKPIWYVMPGGSWDAERRTYSGSLYVPHGSPFYAYDATRFVPGAPVGSVAFTFPSATSAVLDGTINGVAFHRNLVRMPFGTLTLEPFPEQADLWWGGATQNGWGISVLQQYSTFFSVWYTYDADGAATWYVMPGGSWATGDTYEGRIFRASGSPFLGQAYDPARFQATDVGAYRLRFLGLSARFDYSIEGRSGTLSITRQPF